MSECIKPTIQYKGAVDWKWILENMRCCTKCECYKTLDQFTIKGEKCQKCTTTYRSAKKGKPVPYHFKDDSEIQMLINKGGDPPP